MRYKNCGYTPMTYYGVTFKPGDVKEVDGYIHDVDFMKVEDDKENVNDSKMTKSRPAEKSTQTVKLEEPNIKIDETPENPSESKKSSDTKGKE